MGWSGGASVKEDIPSKYGIYIEKLIENAFKHKGKTATEMSNLGVSTKDSWCADFVRWLAAIPGVDPYGGIYRDTSTGVIMNQYIEANRFMLSISMQQDARAAIENDGSVSPTNSGSGFKWVYNGRTYHQSLEAFRLSFTPASTGGSYNFTQESFNKMLAQAYTAAYIPKRGDLIVFRSERNSKFAGPHNHIGIVYEYDFGNQSVKYISGNTNGGTVDVGERDMQISATLEQ